MSPAQLSSLRQKLLLKSNLIATVAALVVGGVFVIEAVSVLIQRTWFKITKKRYGEGRTETEIARMESEAFARFPVQDLLIAHRYGPIAPGEAIVFVAAAAEHRRPAFEAADFLMDYLKTRAPFWKKETGPDGERWIEPRPSDYDDVKRWSPSP